MQREQNAAEAIAPTPSRDPASFDSGARFRACPVYPDITKTIGNTPVVKISDKMCPEGVEVYAKCEYFNPLSSVKDRLALAIIQDAEARGDLKPGAPEPVVRACTSPAIHHLRSRLVLPSNCGSHFPIVWQGTLSSRRRRATRALRLRWSVPSEGTSVSSAWQSPSPSSAAS